MRILIDVMSGDRAPEELLKGAVMARRELGIGITVIGDSEIITSVCEAENIDLSGIDLVHAEEVINMEDPALSVVRDKKNSSMAVGFQLLANGKGDAFVSAGNTGALLAGSTLIVRRIKGIHRAAIGAILPFPTPVLLLDSGANIEVDEKTLEQFAAMGTVYMEKIFSMDTVRVGLLNNGTEPTKGTPLYKSAYSVLSASERIDFVGNVEAKAVPFDVCDVLVCDGFAGNILLKTVEGMGKFFSAALKGLYYENLITKASGLMIKKKLDLFKKQFDASEYGGAPLLGISKPVIKAHGSSDARAVCNAVRQAVAYVETGIIYDIAEHAGQTVRKASVEGTEEE